jgi:hypothetical protein
MLTDLPVTASKVSPGGIEPMFRYLTEFRFGPNTITHQNDTLSVGDEDDQRWQSMHSTASDMCTAAAGTLAANWTFADVSERLSN